MNAVGKVGKRNRLAGSHPSYDKGGLTREAIKKKIAYDKTYQATPARVAYRMELNKKNRQLQQDGTAKVSDGKDVSHRVGYKSGGTILKDGSYLEKAKTNRARKIKK